MPLDDGEYTDHRVTILCQSRLFSPQRKKGMANNDSKKVTILCQSRLFSPLIGRKSQHAVWICNHPLSIEAIFSTFQPLATCDATVGNHPLSIEAIFSTTIKIGSLLTSTLCNHPLSIEAIFSTLWMGGAEKVLSRGNHPLSIEAIFSTNGTWLEKMKITG